MQMVVKLNLMFEPEWVDAIISFLEEHLNCYSQSQNTKTKHCTEIPRKYNAISFQVCARACVCTPVYACMRVCICVHPLVYVCVFK